MKNPIAWLGSERYFTLKVPMYFTDRRSSPFLAGIISASGDSLMIHEIEISRDSTQNCSIAVILGECRDAPIVSWSLLKFICAVAIGASKETNPTNSTSRSH